MREIGRRDSVARVAHGDDDLAVIGLRGNGHLAALRRVPHGVLEQVGEDLREVVRIRARGEPVRDADGERDALAFEAGQRELDGHLDRLPEIDRLERRVSVTVADRELVERAREPDEPVRLLAERGERLRGRRNDAVAQRLEVSDQVGERRAQLVSGVRDELGAKPFLLLQTRGHEVERRRERRDLARSGDGHAHVACSVGHAARRLGDAAERGGEPTREEDREQHAPHDPGEDGDDEEARDALIEHRAGVIHRGTVLDHELLERCRREDEDTDDDDDDRGGRHRDRGERDAHGHGPHPLITAR